MKIFHRREFQPGNRTSSTQIAGEVKARILRSLGCSVSHGRDADCVVSFRARSRRVVSQFLRRLTSASVEFSFVNAHRRDDFSIVAAACLVFCGVLARDSSATSRHAVEMKQTLKTFQRPNTQGKLCILIISHDTSSYTRHNKKIEICPRKQTLLPPVL